MTVSNWSGWPFISTKQLLLPYKHFLAYGTQFGTSPRSQEIPAAVEHLHLQHLKHLVPVHHWDVAMLWNSRIFLFFSYKQGEQMAFASLTQQVTWSCWENWLQELTCPEKGEVPFMHLFFSSLSYVIWSCLSFVQRWFHSLSPLSECLMLSLMSVAGVWTWTCCHGACTDRTATSPCPLLPQMPTAAFNFHLSSQHRHFSDFKRAWSAREVQLPACKILQPWRNTIFPSEASSLEPEICLTEAGKSSRPYLNLWHHSALCSLWFPPARTTCPAHLTCQILLGNSATEWLKLFHEWK